MRRIVISLSAATLLLIGGVVAGSTVGGAAGQPETVPSTEPSTDGATSTDGHPIVGAWLLTDEDAPDEPPTLVAFSADGIFHSAELGVPGLGAWEATGPTSAAMTAVQQSPGERGESEESGTIRATFEVDSDGQSLTGEYTVELVGEGWPAGQYGPGTVTGTRIVVEPMEPVGSFDELFGEFEEGTEPASEDTAMVTETTEAAPPTTS